jgi:hypothetical protein
MCEANADLVHSLEDVCHNYSKEAMERFFENALLRKAFITLAPLMKGSSFKTCENRVNRTSEKNPTRTTLTLKEKREAAKQQNDLLSQKDLNALYAFEIDSLLANAREISQKTQVNDGFA